MNLLKRVYRALRPGRTVEEPDAFFRKTAYSQEGEDLILAAFFTRQGVTRGFYVDVGAHHPFRFSNTYLFYKAGWRGINIDAMPGSMAAFKQDRPLDINLEIPIGAEQAEREFHIFNEGALNSFSRELSAARDGSKGYKKESTVLLKLEPLAAVLERHLPAGQAIDFLTVDVEGLDLEVLTSNDWTRFRPRVVLVEDIAQQSGLAGSLGPCGELLRTQGYALMAKTHNTLIFLRSDT